MLVFHLVNLVQRGRISPQSQHYETHVQAHTHTHTSRSEKLGRKLVMPHLIVHFLVRSMVPHIGFPGMKCMLNIKVYHEKLQ